MPSKIISGGQTGVDRAALDVALELDLSCGGWCPRGRRAEDGRIPHKYPLQETNSVEYPIRTRYNVRDSDGTLILTRGRPDRGTALTRDIARQLGKPFLVVDLNDPPDVSSIKRWMKENNFGVLNVAGPRESSQPGIHTQACDILRRLFRPRAQRKRTPQAVSKPAVISRSRVKISP